MSHMTTVESVITEIGLTHPIVYDIYDFCDYVKGKKLKNFTVSMLKEICTFFKLPFKSRDSKAVLMSKNKGNDPLMPVLRGRIITPSSSDVMALVAVYNGEIL